MPNFGFTTQELKVLAPLKTPALIQDFINRIPIVGKGGDRCRSPRVVLRERRAHCVEGALLGAAALRLIGHQPLIVDLRSAEPDYDHVVAVWRERGRWGSLSKTNYGVLRYREPLYRDIRELVMSYFHEYFLNNGRKTLRDFSKPFNLARFDHLGWMTATEDVWYIPEALDQAPHTKLLTPAQVRKLRSADQIEIAVGKLRQWKR
jgi:hypothetical protein